MSATDPLTPLDAARQTLEPGPHHCTDCGHRVLVVDKHGRCAACEFFAEDSNGEPRPKLRDIALAEASAPPLDQHACDLAWEEDFIPVYRRVYAAAAHHAAYVMEREEAHSEAMREAFEAGLARYVKETRR